MKTIKYFVAGVLMLSLSAPMMAQDNKAVLDQVTKIIESKTDVEAQLKPILKANKKNTAVLVGIGRAFLDAKDPVNALKYAEMAMARDKKYAKAYINMLTSCVVVALRRLSATSMTCVHSAPTSPLMLSLHVSTTTQTVLTRLSSSMEK